MVRHKTEQTVLMTTTPLIENFKITEYCGIVSSEVFTSTNIFKEIVTGIRDALGTRGRSSEKEIRKARQKCTDELLRQAIDLQADAVVNIAFHYSFIGQNGNILLVTATGTAVCAEEI